jgi:hypothetical protein
MPIFGIPGSVVFDMDFRGGPLPPGVEVPTGRLEGPPVVVIICTEAQVRAMETWLRDQQGPADEPELYRKCADLIRRTLPK